MLFTWLGETYNLLQLSQDDFETLYDEVVDWGSDYVERCTSGLVSVNKQAYDQVLTAHRIKLDLLAEADKRRNQPTANAEAEAGTGLEVTL